jgi:hypothetical protein
MTLREFEIAAYADAHGFATSPIDLAKEAAAQIDRAIIQTRLTQLEAVAPRCHVSRIKRTFWQRVMALKAVHTEVPAEQYDEIGY